ncbi:basic salivary proline-rich protein 2-like [Motacilla alba alba]|uniref:basic salivary proline-rich protein 2-like n=1 Tax=Motacilla alba alba TaxID=1094192 RepID=UPI0018D593AB|nr:basic salivary proline-rich protein 2-like [Motacilla alba alba]
MEAGVPAPGWRVTRQLDPAGQGQLPPFHQGPSPRLAPRGEEDGDDHSEDNCDDDNANGGDAHQGHPKKAHGVCQDTPLPATSSGCATVGTATAVLSLNPTEPHGAARCKSHESPQTPRARYHHEDLTVMPGATCTGIRRPHSYPCTRDPQEGPPVGAAPNTRLPSSPVVLEAAQCAGAETLSSGHNPFRAAARSETAGGRDRPLQQPPRSGVPPEAGAAAPRSGVPPEAGAGCPRGSSSLPRSGVPPSSGRPQERGAPQEQPPQERGAPEAAAAAPSPCGPAPGAVAGPGRAGAGRPFVVLRAEPPGAAPAPPRTAGGGHPGAAPAACGSRRASEPPSG